MSDGPYCAHLRVSYRTELVDAPGLVGMTKATRGWWECDLGCGAKFLPESASAAFLRGFEAAREMAAKAALKLHSEGCPGESQIAAKIRALTPADAHEKEGGGGK